MEFKRVIWLGLVLALPLSAGAKPAYLKCKLDGNDKAFDVTVDEELGRVTFGRDRVFDKASFTASEISFERDTGSGVASLTEEYTIDRTTLAYRSVWVHWGRQENGMPKESVSTGQCEVTKPPERKI